MASTAPTAMKYNKDSFDPKEFLVQNGEGRTIANYRQNDIICAQGDALDAVFYIETGRIKLSIISPNGKEAVLSLRGEGDFFGVRSLVRVHRRVTTATALTDCTIVRITTSAMTRLLRDEPHFVELYTSYLMLQHARDQENLADLLTNSAEKRLARILLQLADFGPEADPKPIPIRISQETFAEMVGTTRSRVNYFLNKFRRLGFIEYKGNLVVHRELSNIVQRR
jgi:CRP/FNR family cyclic AMP-dependent transcriptional regulator